VNLVSTGAYLPYLQLQILVRHRAFAGAGHVRGVFGEHAARVTRRGFLPRFLALGQFFRGNVESDLALLGVNDDGVAVLHEGEESASAFLPGTDASGHGLNGFVAQPFAAFAGVVAVTVLKLEEESSHAERAKRGSERLVTGGSQFSRIERISFHRSPLV